MDWTLIPVILMVILIIVGLVITRKDDYSGKSLIKKTGAYDKHLYRPVKTPVDTGQKTGAYIDADVLKGELNRRYKLTYTDSDGDATEREVTVHRVLGFIKTRVSKGQPFVQYIQGYCHLRKEERTFSVRNIEELLDLSTGELFEGWGIVGHFVALCDERPNRRRSKWEQSPETTRTLAHHDFQFRHEFSTPVSVVFSIKGPKTYEAEIKAVEQTRYGLRIETQCKLRPRKGERNWSGQKKFYVHQDSEPKKIKYNGMSFETVFEFLDHVLSPELGRKARKISVP